VSSSVDFTATADVEAVGLRGIYFLLTDVEIPRDGSRIDDLVAQAEDEVRASWTPDRLAEDPVLLGFQTLHDRVGRGGRKNVASPTSLIEALIAGGALPRVNVLVDLYNVISIKSRLALGAHDTARIDGNVTLRLTRGDEVFIPLGRDKPRGIGPGEYAYIDDANDVLCRMETRQVEKTKVTTDTTSCFYIVQGNDATELSYIESAAEDLIGLTQQHCGGTVSAFWRVGVT
jgi:DNA/RNA-binding domain of Phe-tRNA-synthetase-like protein